jgi:AraC family transcriptional regulator of adaptative response / DNA-3-methyladenine glycosylase II
LAISGWTFADLGIDGAHRCPCALKLKVEYGPETSNPSRRVDYHGGRAAGIAIPHESPYEAMTLDWQVCSRARLSRDPRFDGKFFIGVLGSMVYCRSICPAPTALEKNCRYFPTAAAAAEAGYRPCLRCRPECSPGTPAWLGTSNTVSRALRLIGESGLDESGLEGLAERLGVGARHLRRLFIRHLGATPSAVAQTRRLHFAKKLIDETQLPMSQIALASGFGSVRRFNAAIRKTYKRTPTQIRHLARQKIRQSENEYAFDLRFRPPYDWAGMLAFLEARATPGIESVKSGHYSRSISVDGTVGSVDVSLDAEHNSLRVHIRFGDPRALFFIIDRIRTMFDLNADWNDIAQVLRSDPSLSGLIDSAPGLRVPGCWDGFELAIRAILGQQITVRGATTLAGRLVKSFGRPLAGTTELTHLFPTAEILADADLSAVGLTKSRSATIRALARTVCDGQISFQRIADFDTLLDRLVQIPGIGRWTAQYVAMRALGDPDAFLAGDVALLSALKLTNTSEFERRSEAWRPWRSYATMYLWTIAKTKGTPRKQISRSTGSENELTSINHRDAAVAETTPPIANALLSASPRN